MEKPEYYDLTENRVVIIQGPAIERELKKYYWQGFQLGSIWGSFGLAVSLLFMLVTAQIFGDFLGIKGDTWKAIFILLFIISSLVFIMLFFINIPNFCKRIFRKAETVDKFFEENKKIKT